MVYGGEDIRTGRGKRLHSILIAKKTFSLLCWRGVQIYIIFSKRQETQRVSGQRHL